MVSCAPHTLGARAVDLRLKYDEQQSGASVQWTITNNMEKSIWIPVKWGDVKLPGQFLTPNGNIAIIIAQFGIGSDRQEMWETCDTVTEYHMLRPSQSLAGSVTLSIPLSFQFPVSNPYSSQREGLFEIERREVTQVSGLYMVVQYEVENPSRHSLGLIGASDDRRSLECVALDIIRGTRGFGVEVYTPVKYVISPRLECEISLQHPVTLYENRRPSHIQGENGGSP